MYQAENIRAVLAGRGAAYAVSGPASTGRCCCSVSRVCSPTSRRRWSRRSCRSISSTRSASPRCSSGSSTASTRARRRCVRVASGLLADRWRRHKEVAVLGYGALGALQAGCSCWSAQRAARARSRSSSSTGTGKGIRTAPRDALISLSTPPDATRRRPSACTARSTRSGAMLGPLLAFALLALRPGHFNADLRRQLLRRASSASACSCSSSRTARLPRAALRPSRSRCARGAPARRSDRFRRARRRSARAARLVTISDGFLYLVLQRRSTSTRATCRCCSSGTAAIVHAARHPRRPDRRPHRAVRGVFLARIMCLSWWRTGCSCARPSALAELVDLFWSCSAPLTRRPTAS